MDAFVFDELKWAKDPEILKVIRKEILYYSNKIDKINNLNFRQGRNLVLTDESLYNFEKKKLKRKIEYNKIKGITYSKINPELFIVHGNEVQHDYYFQSRDRNLIINIISKFYEEQMGNSLKICEVNEKTLKNYLTAQKEKKRDANYSRMDESKLIDTKKFLEKNQAIRKSSSLNIFEENNIIEDEIPKINKMNMIFCNEKYMEQATLEDFKIIKILGRGEYGKVFLVRYRDTNHYYAMKSIKKDKIDEILIKQQIIQNLKFKFLIGCCACFQTEERIYFIMNLIEGESFSEYLLNKNTTEENQIKFFAAIIGLTLEYLHKNGIAYRNLRPNDIKIEKDGYLKISDFKLSSLFNLKQNSEISKEQSEYIPPEELTTKKISKNGDWWIYGIILYKLFFGIPPFFSEDKTKLQELIIKNELKFPDGGKASKSAKDLISKLLNKNPDKRLGNSKDFEEIKTHEFFQGINFDDIINKKMKSNYKPKIRNIINEREEKIFVSYEDLINCKILKFNIE